MGLLNTQTASRPSRGIQGENYTVVVVQRQVFGRSNLAAIVVNRLAVGSVADSARFTRIVGLEYNLQTADNRWSGKLFYQRAQKAYALTDAYTHGSTVTYTSRNLTLSGVYEYAGQHYLVNDVSYVPRTGYWRYNPQVVGTFYVKGERSVISHGPSVSGRFIRNLDGRLTDHELDFDYTGQFRSTAEAGVGYYHYYTYLFSPTTQPTLPTRPKARTGTLTPTGTNA